ncbi:hypothetical protein KTD08_10395 [Burkholderia multivorans]|uniref:hypothetical protein n=1 Tax=Burkholderia multivorans TaxID=87883 RepID=UPI001C22B0C3|nr:hypothetical protein [Burkholderia multivorans]MBU9125599.1 hypothetical protein [Burkholderia multivorans]
MAWRQHRWFRRWVIVVAFWAVPVAIVAVREIREEMAYNKADLQLALTTWQLTDAQQAAGAAAKCHGDADEARAAGCPAEVLAANAPRQQAARDEYVVRRNTLASYLWHAFIGYWVVPALFLFGCGVVIALIRRALRRPPIKPPVKPPIEPPVKPPMEPPVPPVAR